MRLIKRVNAILTAQLNDIVDTFEKPERMLKQAIREMEAALESAIESTAKAIAAEKRLRRERADAQAQCRVVARSGRPACSKGSDDASARQALARKIRKAETCRLARAANLPNPKRRRPVCGGSSTRSAEPAGRRETASGVAGGAAARGRGPPAIRAGVGTFRFGSRAFRRFENCRSASTRPKRRPTHNANCGRGHRRRPPRSASRGGACDPEAAECRNRTILRVKSWRLP